MGRAGKEMTVKRNAKFLKRYGGGAVLLLLAAFVFALAASAACEHIIVSGAGYTPVNGTYVRGGDAYGKPTYALGGTYRVTWMGKWYLSNFVGETYYQNDSSAAEPPSSGWESLRTVYDPAPTLSCADNAPAERLPAPKIIGRSYMLEGESLTLVYENVGNASGTVSQLYAGPALRAQSADGGISFWIPDSDLWQVVSLDQTCIVAPGKSLTLVLPMIELPQDWLEVAAARSAAFTDFTFDAPHIAVGVDGSPASWIHLVPAWLEQVQGQGE
jgi:hypothetical protein